jgi:hypothetical protein
LQPEEEDRGYCKDGSEPTYDRGFPQDIAGSWRKRYQHTEYLPPCSCFGVRICGVWCNYPDHGIQPVKEFGKIQIIERLCEGD